MGWRFFATRLRGEGREDSRRDVIDWNLPVSNPEISNVINGHGGLRGTLKPEHPRLTGLLDLLEPYRTAIYAEIDGQIRGGGILTEPEEDSPELRIDAIGHTSYLAGMPYTGEKLIERGDPLSTSWHMWQHTQARPGFDLGITRTGDTKSKDVFIGDPDTAPSSTPKRINPYVLAWWQTHDLAREFDQMAELGDYEWTMRHSWAGDHIRHDLVYGYPRLGRRRHDLRFVVGENVTQQPPITADADEWASHIIVLGTGEGRAMMHHIDTTPPTGRLARYAVITDKALATPSQVKARAAAELKARQGGPDITELKVLDHPNARFGSYEPGDDIYITTKPGWHDSISAWVKILAVTITPDQTTTTLTVRRAEKVN
ncbi:hypothetical protein [Brevibacterium luteolum]|uniref:hypothetical protein n=1 Tax=Brevibacterium luteolum TaxID=199591 RepID=UPI003B683384